MPAPAPIPSSTRPGFGPPRIRHLRTRLLGARTAWELFGRGARVVVRIQLARGRITTTPIPPLDSNGPVSFVVSGPIALVRPLDSVAGYEIIDGRRARAAPGALAAGGPVLPGPRPGQFWAPDGRNRVVLVGVQGRPLSPRISIRVPRFGFPQADGSGYVVIDTGHGVYDARPARRLLLTRGALLAAGPLGWLTSVCQHHRCRYTAVSPAGTRRSVPVHTRPGVLRPIATGSISPDGARAALITTRGALVVLDLSSGAVTTVKAHSYRHDDTQQSGQIAWSPDSRWLIVAHAGEVSAIQTPANLTPQPTHPAASALRLGVRLPHLIQIAVPPAAGPPH